MKQYDYLVVGAGLFGAVFAHEAKKAGKRCLVLDRRNHVGGNLYCQSVAGIHVHRYGSHIFHTSNQAVWDYVGRLVKFNRFINSPLANYKGEIYNLPFNMNTFKQMWGVESPEEARHIIAAQVEAAGIKEPKNLEEQAISLVGTDIYEKLIKHYTQKQWGRPCSALPAFIIKRLPVRFTYDNNYFNDRYQGIPVGGYNTLFDRLLEGIDVRLSTDYLANRGRYAHCKTVVYTGAIDAYYDYCFGALEYRGLRFETEILDTADYQGNAVVNFTDGETPYTRIIEHKHFEFGTQPQTVITKEYPAPWTRGGEPFYPINDEKNQALYEKYAELARQEHNLILGGRLGEYRYYDMDQVVARALEAAGRII